MATTLWNKGHIFNAFQDKNGCCSCLFLIFSFFQFHFFPSPQNLPQRENIFPRYSSQKVEEYSLVSRHSTLDGLSSNTALKVPCDTNIATTSDVQWKQLLCLCATHVHLGSHPRNQMNTKNTAIWKVLLSSVRHCKQITRKLWVERIWQNFVQCPDFLFFYVFVE